MFRYAQTNGSPFWVLQHFRHFACRRQYECVWARGERFNQAIGPVINASVQADLREICTYQREVMFLVGAPNLANSVDSLPVTNMAPERVAGVSRIRNETTALDDARDDRHPMRLRVCWVHFDEFSHARIVGEQRLRGYPCNTLLFVTKLAARRGLMNLIFEFLPLILFLGAFMYKGIYAAIAVLMIAMPIGLLVKYIRTKSLDKMYFWSTVFLLIAGSLTLYFRNPLFLYWKPTVFYWVVAVAFLGSQFFSEVPMVQRFFGLVDGLSLEKITPTQWKKLNVVWVLFFIGAGVLNIYVAYNFEQATWVNFKVFGLMALTFVFMIGQTFWIANLIGDDDAEETEEQD